MITENLEGLMVNFVVPLSMGLEQESSYGIWNLATRPAGPYNS